MMPTLSILSLVAWCIVAVIAGVFAWAIWTVVSARISERIKLWRIRRELLRMQRHIHSIVEDAERRRETKAQ